jgi:hypothetical protein
VDDRPALSCDDRTRGSSDSGLFGTSGTVIEPLRAALPLDDEFVQTGKGDFQER